MAFEPKTQAFNASIAKVTIGTGDKAVTLGGVNVLPFYSFDAPIENAPKIGVEITDAGIEAYTQQSVWKKCPVPTSSACIWKALTPTARTSPLRSA